MQTVKLAEGVCISRVDFIQQYVTNFLASYAAVNYSDHCLRGWEKFSHPVEDASFLAEQAWEELVRLA
jgi:hypothetical protein